MELKLLSSKKDHRRFEQLAKEEERRVYSLCYHMMGSREDALDCAQETMLRAYRGFSGFREEASFSTWIRQIALNVCRDVLRKRHDTVSLDALREEEGFDPADDAPTAYAMLEEKERMRVLEASLARLPTEMKQMIVLRDIQGLSYEEIAETLRLPTGTVRSRLNRARKKLSEFLKTSELFSSESVYESERR